MYDQESILSIKINLLNLIRYEELSVDAILDRINNELFKILVQCSDKIWDEAKENADDLVVYTDNLM